MLRTVTSYRRKVRTTDYSHLGLKHPVLDLKERFKVPKWEQIKKTRYFYKPVDSCFVLMKMCY